jgi:hypothetical protein
MSPVRTAVAQGGREMRSVLRLFVVVATIVALTAIAPSVSAASPRSGDLHFTKDCHSYTGLAGSHCVITSSSLKAIEVGSWIVYASPLGATGVDSDVVLDPPGPGNNMAFGHCTLVLATLVGGCTFWGGTGKFTHFHASTNTTLAAPRVWHEDGTYSFSPAG